MSERTSYVLPGVALVLLGFATGWFLQGARQEVLPEKLRSEVPAKTSRANERLRIALDELGLVEDPGALLEAIERIPPEQMRAYLQALRNRAGLRGLQERDQAILSTMLAVWHAENAEETLGWILAHEDEASRIGLLYRLLEAADFRDPVAAMKIGVEHLVSARGEFRIPSEPLQAALEEGPEALLSCLKLAVHRSATGHSVALDFPDSFDFPGFASALTDHLSKLPKGMQQLVLPANLAEEWAREDPAAAFLWTSHHPDAATGPGLRASLDAIAELPPGTAGGIFAGVMQAPEANPALVLEGLAEVLHTESNPQILAAFLAGVPSPDAREAHLAALFQGTFRPDGDHRSNRVRHLVLAQMEPEERLAFLDEFMRRQKASPAPLQFDKQIELSMREELQRLDHTSEEIASIMKNFSPAPELPSP